MKKPNLSKEDARWAQEVFEKLEAKLSAETDRTGSKIPYIAVDGRYQEDKGETDVVWWTNGFWPGMLWQMYHATGDEKYRKTAEEVEARLDKALDKFEGLHHDVGFMWLHSAVADYRLTGNERSKTRAMHAANLLAGRYNPRGKYLRSWNRDRAGWVIVDSLMNIPLLYWASQESGDPRFRFMAQDHGDTVMKNTQRADGSCNHIIVLDPENGELLETPGGQGYEPGSSWSRGQSWAVYGFALSYRHSGNPAYLDAAKRTANYVLAQAAQTGPIFPVDFRAPKEPEYIDTIAGVCTACGLLEISEHVPENEKDFYVNAAVKLLRAAAEEQSDWNPETDGILQNCTGSYHSVPDRHVPMVYGDYFLLEGILRLLGRDVHLW